MENINNNLNILHQLCIASILIFAVMAFTMFLLWDEIIRTSPEHYRQWKKIKDLLREHIK